MKGLIHSVRNLGNKNAYRQLYSKVVINGRVVLDVFIDISQTDAQKNVRVRQYLDIKKILLKKKKNISLNFRGFPCPAICCTHNMRV